MAEWSVLMTYVTDTWVGVPLKARFYPELNGDSLHRNFHNNPSPCPDKTEVRLERLSHPSIHPIQNIVL